MITTKIDGSKITPEELDKVLTDIEEIVFNPKGTSPVALAFPKIELEIEEASTEQDSLQAIEKLRYAIDGVFHKIRKKLLDHNIHTSKMSATNFGYIEETEVGDIMGQVIDLFVPSGEEASSKYTDDELRDEAYLTATGEFLTENFTYDQYQKTDIDDYKWEPFQDWDKDELAVNITGMAERLFMQSKKIRDK